MNVTIHHQRSIYQGAALCITCAVEAFWQGSSGNMQERYDVGIEWLPRIGTRKRHAVSRWSSQKNQSMCGQQKGIV